MMLFFFFQLTIEYVFNVSPDYWSLIGADIDWEKSANGNVTLYLNDDRPEAPADFSYKCERNLVFGNKNYSLYFSNIQVRTNYCHTFHSHSHIGMVFFISFLFDRKFCIVSIMVFFVHHK